MGNVWFEPAPETGYFVLKVKGFQIKRNQIDFIQHRFPGIDLQEIQLVVNYRDQRYMLHSPKNKLVNLNDFYASSGQVPTQP